MSHCDLWDLTCRYPISKGLCEQPHLPDVPKRSQKTCQRDQPDSCPSCVQQSLTLWLRTASVMMSYFLLMSDIVCVSLVSSGLFMLYTFQLETVFQSNVQFIDYIAQKWFTMITVTDACFLCVFICSVI